MSVYEPKSHNLREALKYEEICVWGSSNAQAAVGARMCRDWFKRFKNGFFHVENWYSGGKEKIVDIT